MQGFDLHAQGDDRSTCAGSWQRPISSVICTGVGSIFVLDEVTELGAVLADRLFQRNSVRHGQGQLDLVDSDASFFGDLVGSGITAQLRFQRSLRSAHRSERVVEMNRDANRA